MVGLNAGGRGVAFDAALDIQLRRDGLFRESEDGYANVIARGGGQSRQRREGSQPDGPQHNRDANQWHRDRNTTLRSAFPVLRSEFVFQFGGKSPMAS